MNSRRRTSSIGLKESLIGRDCGIRPAGSPRRAAVGSNAQCEQFNDANPDHQHGECYRIIVDPISPWMPRYASLFPLH